MVSQKNTVSIKSTFILRHKMNTFEATLITKLPSIYMFYTVEGGLFSLCTVQTSGNLVEFLSKVKLDLKTSIFFFKFLLSSRKVPVDMLHM